MKSARAVEADSAQRGSVSITALFAGILAMLAATFGLHLPSLATTATSVTNASQPAAAAQPTTQQFPDLSSGQQQSDQQSSQQNSAPSAASSQGSSTSQQNSASRQQPSQAAAPVTAPVVYEYLSPPEPTTSQTFAPELARLQTLGSQLQSDIAALPSDEPASSYITAPAWAASQAIDQLSGTTLSNITVHGVSGLAPSDIPALAYLPITGGTISGLSNFADASTSLFSAFGPAYFGATATSSFNSAGALTLASALAVGSGGTGWATVNAGSILFGNGSSALATSSNLFWDNTDGRLGIGTSSPAYPLDVNGSARVTAGLHLTVDSTDDLLFDTKPQSPGFPVPMFQPGSLAPTNSNLALDLFPKGSPGNYGSNGVTWQDICNVDLPDNSGAPWVCAHSASLANGDVFFGTNTGNGGTAGRVMFGDVVNGSSNWIYPDGDFWTTEGYVRGAGNSIDTAVTTEDASKNILAYSNSFSNWTTFTATVGSASNEDPFGATNATLLTSTSANGGMDEYTAAIPNDSAVYSVSLYVNAASVSGAGGVSITASLQGGTAIAYGMILVPSTGAVGPTNTTPTGCGLTQCFGVETIKVGCPTGAGCAATSDTWYRTWFTVRNNSTGNVAMQIVIRPDSGGTGSAIIYGAQVEPTTFPTSYINTKSSTVARPAGVNLNAPLYSPTIAVGTTTPYSRLEVWGPDSAATTSAFSVVNNASTTVFAAYDNGNATYSGSIFQSSDQRLKTNVQSLDASSSLSEIESLNPVSYLRLDQPGTGENLGFIAQQVQQIFPQLVSTSTPTALTPDGTLTLNYEGLISPIVSAIKDIASISDSFQSALIAWLGNAQNGIQDLFTQNIYATNELCIDNSAGTPVCITGDQLAAVLSAANAPNDPESVTSNGAGESAATSTPPMIEINGDNPATVDVGTTYSDLGATITGPQQDLNLGIEAIVDGGATTTPAQIEIDTTQPGTHTIEYITTDQNGLEGSATRTVIVSAPAQSVSDASSTDATSTDATSTPSSQ